MFIIKAIQRNILTKNACPLIRFSSRKTN